MDHELHIEGKNKIEVTEVTGVEEFDETVICVNLKEENLILCGNHLHIETLDLDTGKLVASGKIESASYTKKSSRKGFFERFRK